jgi:hypothetical protein
MTAHDIDRITNAMPDAEVEGALSEEIREKFAAEERNDRRNRVLLPFWTIVSARKQLKYLALEEDRTQQNLLEEALNMLFLSRGRPPIA